MSRSLRACLIPLAAIALVLTGCRSTGASEAAAGGDADRAALLRLDEQVLRAQIVARDSALFADLAVDEFRILAPGGMIEDKGRAIAGIGAWDVSDIVLSGTEVVFHGPVALVTGRLDIDGEMRPVGRWGPLKYISTWVREEGDWRLFSRSLTPCLDRLVEMGRC